MPFSRPPFTGFPFDDNTDSRNSFRSELDDIAKRHPEFAEHLQGGWTTQRPRRSATPDQQQNHSFGPHSSPYTSERLFSRDRPFGSRFEEFGFPFTPDFDDDPRFFNEQRQPKQQQRPPQQSEKVNEQEFEQKIPDNTQKPPHVPREEQRKANNIQQSNTVDLGQKQPPVDDNRNQRSMSAPPENRNTSGKRFTSSINIPNLNPVAGEMGGRMSSQPETNPPPSQSSGRPHERIIPIHIEGRDEPVIPKNVNATFAQPQKLPPQNPPPQAETLFGQRPGTFTQFVPKTETPSEDLLKKQQEEYQKQQEEYQKQQEENFLRKQAAPPKPTPLDLIQNIQKDVSALMNQVEQFEGQPKDKEYRYLDEMLTRNLLKLDNIETEGKDTIRQARKEAIKCIEQCIAVLETKANVNEAKQKSEAAPEEPKTEEKMEVEKEPTPPQSAVETNPGDSAGAENPMEVEVKPAEAAETVVVEEASQETTESTEKKKCKKKAEKK